MKFVIGIAQRLITMAQDCAVPRDLAGNNSEIYVITVTIPAAMPMPVRIRAANMKAGPGTNAVSSEPTEAIITKLSSDQRRPMRSDTTPPSVAPTNMPRKLAEVMNAI